MISAVDTSRCRNCGRFTTALTDGRCRHCHRHWVEWGRERWLKGYGPLCDCGRHATHKVTVLIGSSSNWDQDRRRKGSLRRATLTLCDSCYQLMLEVEHHTDLDNKE